MGSGTGSTLDLDFSLGVVLVDDVFRHSGLSVHPMDHRCYLIVVVSFRRYAFPLTDDYIVAALESAIGD